MIARRSFLLGLGATLAAPAVVRASSLMPVRAPELVTDSIYEATHPLWRNRVTWSPVRNDVWTTIWMDDGVLGPAQFAVRHRPDMTDLAEPYRRAVEEARAWRPSTPYQLGDVVSTGAKPGS